MKKDGRMAQDELMRQSGEFLVRWRVSQREERDRNTEQRDKEALASTQDRV